MVFLLWRVLLVVVVEILQSIQECCFAIAFVARYKQPECALLGCEPCGNFLNDLSQMWCILEVALPCCHFCSNGSPQQVCCVFGRVGELKSLHPNPCLGHS